MSTAWPEYLNSLPSKLETALQTMLAKDEIVRIKLAGAFKQGLVVTNKRVIILKSGFQTSQMFGLSQFQMPLSLITSADVSQTMGSGFLEISSGGVQATRKSYWGGTATKALNCVSFAKNAGDFQRVSTIITQLATEARNEERGKGATEPSAVTSDIAASLQTLWKMKSEGALTEAEFEAAKAKLIA